MTKPRIYGRSGNSRHTCSGDRKKGQNVRLSSQITGWKLNVLDQETADEQTQEKSASISSILVEKLDVDEDLANTLISNG